MKKNIYKSLIVLVLLLSFSCTNNDNDLLIDGNKSLINKTFDVFNFPDNTKVEIQYDENKNLIQNENYELFLDKTEKFSEDGELALVYNGKNKPYDIEYLNGNIEQSVRTTSLYSVVTIYDNDDYTGNTYSQFNLNSSYNYYNKDLDNVYRNYTNNIGSGGTVDLEYKVSSVKLFGWSEIQFYIQLPCINTVIIQNHTTNQSTKYVELSDVSIFCWGYSFLNANNRATSVIVKI